MKVQSTLTGKKGKKGAKETDAKKAKITPKRDMVYWCKWRGVLEDTVDAFTGERVRILDGTLWGTWIVAPEGESNGRLEHLAWDSVARQRTRPDPRPRRVIARLGNDGHASVESLNESDAPYVPGTFVSPSIQEVQQIVQLDGISSLGYRDQMRGLSRFAMHGITNLAHDYSQETAHLRSHPGLAPVPDEPSSSDSDGDSDSSSDSIFGEDKEEKEKKKVKA